MKAPPMQRLLVYSLATLVTLISLVPLLYAMATSLKTGSAIFAADFFPQAPTLENYRRVLDGVQPFGKSFFNSLLVASATVAFSLLISLTTAYALGRIRFAGKGLLLATLLGISMFPQVAVLSGMFELIQSLGLYNKAWGLVLPYTAFTLPFTVWMLTSFMRELPTEIEEAAILDGCGPLTIIFKVFIPLLWPALVSTGLLAFIGAWNEFLFALSFVVDDGQRTVPVAISLISGATSFEIPWGAIMAGSVLVTLPLLALVLVFQKRIVSGLTAGAVK